MSSKRTSPKSSANNMKRNPDIYTQTPINNINICMIESIIFLEPYNKIQFIRFPYFPPANSSSYIHNLVINGKVYDNVLKINKDQMQGNKNYLYYNMENGILQINFESGHSLSKLK
jgi:hypothetical protein